MLWVKYIDQSLLFNISFSNGSDNINFTLKKSHYMWERRVITCEKEGSTHVRKKGHYTWERMVLHMRKKGHYTWEKMVLHMRKKSWSCVAMFLSVILYTFTVHLPFKEMFTFLLLCMNVTCSFLMFTLLNLKLKTLTSLPIKTIRFDIEQITRQKCLKTN